MLFVSSSLRATLKISGSNTTSPTSKNIGMPMMKAAPAMAQGSMRVDVLVMMRLAMLSVTPPAARMRPSMAPSATTRPTAPSVWPAPASIDLISFSPGMPVTRPTPMEVMISARSGWSRMRDTISTTRKITLPSAVARSAMSEEFMVSPEGGRGSAGQFG
ncbi:hypothetical protein D3C73_550610 [compost metagenome]